MDILIGRELPLHTSSRCRSCCSPDPRVVAPVDVYQFQGQAAHRLNQQHIQLGLRKGMTVLLYYRVQGGAHTNQVFQAVLIAHESITNRAKQTENKLWKRVVPL